MSTLFFGVMCFYLAVRALNRATGHGSSALWLLESGVAALAALAAVALICCCLAEWVMATQQWLALPPQSPLGFCLNFVITLLRGITGGFIPIRFAQ